MIWNPTGSDWHTPSKAACSEAEQVGPLPRGVSVSPHFHSAPANVAGKATEGGPGIGPLYICVDDLEEAPGFRPAQLLPSQHFEEWSNDVLSPCLYLVDLGI